MATTKKSTTKKTKTGGAKKTVKSSKKPVSAQEKVTTKNQVSAVSETSVENIEKSSAKKLSKPAHVFKKLNDRNWMFGLVYAASAVAVVIAGNDAYRSVTTTFVTTDTLRVGQDPTFVQAFKVLFDVNLLYLVAVVLSIGAFMHLLTATIFRSRYESDIARGTNRLRWLGHGLGDGVAIAGVGLFAGISDITTLATILVLVLISTIAVTAVSSRVGGSKLGRMVTFSGALLALSPWLIIGAYVLSATQYGTGFPVGYVWALTGSVFVAYLGYLVIEYLRVKQKGFVAEFANVEWMYMLIGFVLKGVFAGIIFTEILR